MRSRRNLPTPDGPPMPRSDRPGFDWTPRRISLVLGAIAGLAVVLTLAGPGITVDEPLDVRPGRT